MCLFGTITAQNAAESALDSTKISVLFVQADSSYIIRQELFYNNGSKQTIDSPPKTGGDIVTMYKNIIATLEKKKEEMDKQIQYYTEIVKKFE